METHVCDVLMMKLLDRKHQDKHVSVTTLLLLNWVEPTYDIKEIKLGNIPGDMLVFLGLKNVVFSLTK